MYASTEQPVSSSRGFDDRGETKQPVLRQTLARLFATVAVWQARWHQRRVLEGLDGRDMKDLGLSRADVYREASKPFWIA